MTLSLDLPDDILAQIRECVDRGDKAEAYRLLVSAVAPAIESLINGSQRGPWPSTDKRHRLSSEEFESLADRLADEMAADLGPDFRGLSDYAVSRDSIYEDHP